jgi:imidazolonepropionase-like amidohydrolase
MNPLRSYRRLAGLVLLLLTPTVARAEPVALVGATLHPVSSEVIEGGILILDGDTLVAIGREVPIPPEARILDLSGKHIYPAFLHPDSVLGLTEISAVRATVDTKEHGDFNPELAAEVAFHGDSALLPPAVAGGILFAHVVPQGGVLAGTSALLRLSGWNWRDMTVRALVAQHLYFPALVDEEDEDDDGERLKAKRDRHSQLQGLKAIFDDAKAYRQALPAGLAPDLKLAALLPVLDGTIPLFVHASEQRQILEALDFVEQQKVPRVVLVSGQDAVEVAPRLAAAGIPVLLSGVLRLPERSWDPYDAPYTAAGRLRQAGVQVLVGDGGGAANARNLPFHAAMAVAFGLDPEEALRGLTLGAAELLGVADRLGSLEVGKEASFLVTDGDPLEITTHIEAVWSAGVPIDLSRNRQLQLYERYRSRPALP